MRRVQKNKIRNGKYLSDFFTPTGTLATGEKSERQEPCPRKTDCKRRGATTVPGQEVFQYLI